MSHHQYLRLLDWSGRQIRLGKRGRIPPDVTNVLEQMQINTTNWLRTVQHYGRLFYRMVGQAERMIEAIRNTRFAWLAGTNASRAAFCRPPG